MQFEHTSGRPPGQFIDPLQAKLEAVQTQDVRSLQHMARVQNQIENVSGTHIDREVTGSPKYGDLHRSAKPKHNHKRRNSGDWSPSGENRPDEAPKTQAVRGKPRRGRRRSAERRERGKGERGRGRAREPMIRGRDTDSEQFQSTEFKNEQRFGRRLEQRDPRHPVVDDRQVEGIPPFRDNWNRRQDPTEFGRENDQFRPGMGGPERPPVRDRLAVKDFRGDESPLHVRDDFVRAGSPGLHEKRTRGIGHDRRGAENMEHFEPRPSGPEMRQDPEFRLREETQRGFDSREHNLPPVPFHDDPRDQPVGEPLSKKPRPLLSDVEINELRNRKGASPNTGRMTPPPVLQEGFPNHPFDRPMDVHPHPLHSEGPFPHEHSFYQNQGPPGPGMPGELRPHTPPLQQHPGEWAPGFEIPRELKLDHQNEIMMQVCRLLLL